MPELNNFDSMLIGLASPEKILEWSYGEVKKPETINYRTLKPERDGLFCERIFGPTKDWECHCGKYKRIRYKGIICDKCGVEVTRSKVRRERMGHIKLAAPVSHIWYFKGTPSRMGLLLDVSPRALDRVLYFAMYIVIDPGTTDLQYGELLSDKDYNEKIETYGAGSFKAGMGAEAVKEMLQAIDLEKLSKELKEEAAKLTGQKRLRVVKRLEVVEAFRQSGNDPTWMIMDVVPVIPPELRPMVQLDGDRFATSDLNDLYRRVINRNNRLKRLLELGAPGIIVRNEKRMLQEAVDALIDNGRRGKAVTGPGNRQLKSLSDMLRGKQGRFRQNLLGKRVDYSGRSVIVVGPDLKMYQCGLPKEMALELFKPFVMKKLVESQDASNIKSAKRMVERSHPKVWDVLESVISEHPVLLNRAPTLHRLGIQAFEPVLVEGRAIRLHPLVCKAFNADFDGDQMAVHVPLSVEAQAEARFLMLSAHNILKPQDGKPVTVPTQDMILGSYYLTVIRPGAKGEGSIFADTNEAIKAYQTGVIDLQAQIKVRLEREWNGEMRHKIVDTSVGYILFNEAVPQDIGFVDRTDPDNLFTFEINEKVDSDRLGEIVDMCYHTHGPTKTCEVLDNIKHLGYMYSTKGALTVSVMDIKVPEAKKAIIDEAEKAVAKTTRQYRRGMINEESRYKDIVEIWTNATDRVTAELKNSMDPFNPIFMMANSGARGNMNQIRQLAGMRGLMANTSGKIVEMPIRANFREGLNVLEFFISSHGTRKGMADTALRTADSGYLTRRLVDVSQETIVQEIDCYESAGEVPRGIEVSAIMNGAAVIESLSDRIMGRVSVNDIADPVTGEIIVHAQEIITTEMANQIEAAGIETVSVRSVLSCRCPHGVCARCYGANLATGSLVDVGEAVGIIAAQSIGEPGTQLTMRTFHTGGVASSEDITQGLPRVEELFEARKPKGQAVISEISGTISFEENRNRNEITVTGEDGDSKTYLIPFGSRLKVTEGQVIEAGDELTEGSVNPHDILTIRGIKGVQSYLIREVQVVYRLQGVSISDKHIEVIVRQMLRKVKIEEAGDTSMLPGSLVDIFKFEEENLKAFQNGGKPAIAKRVLLGITKAALATDSFLSAASFQETTRVLTEAAIKGKTDELLGLKENVIIGKLIPAGTGMKRYRDIRIETVGNGVMQEAMDTAVQEKAETQDDDLDTDDLEVISFDDNLNLDEIPDFDI